VARAPVPIKEEIKVKEVAPIATARPRVVNQGD
jgi:hypothetical protein